MDQHLLSDSALEAFVLDHFPQVKRLYGSGMDRTAKVNLLLEHISCDQIYRSLCGCYPQAATHSATNRHPNNNGISGTEKFDVSATASNGENCVRYFLVLTGTIDELDEPKLRALVSHIRRISGDAELTLEAIKSGSIILHFKGTAEGMDRLRDAFRAGELQEILGHRLQDISEDKRPVDEQTKQTPTVTEAERQRLGQEVAEPLHAQIMATHRDRRHNRRGVITIMTVVMCIGLLTIIILEFVQLPPSNCIRKQEPLAIKSTHIEQLLPGNETHSQGLNPFQIDPIEMGPDELLRMLQAPAVSKGYKPHSLSSPSPARNPHLFAILNSGRASHLDPIILGCAREQLGYLPLREGTLIKLERSGTLAVVEAPASVYESGFNVCLRQGLSRITHSILPPAITIKVIK